MPVDEETGSIATAGARCFEQGAKSTVDRIAWNWIGVQLYVWVKIENFSVDNDIIGEVGDLFPVITRRSSHVDQLGILEGGRAVERPEGARDGRITRGILGNAVRETTAV